MALLRFHPSHISFLLCTYFILGNVVLPTSSKLENSPQHHFTNKYEAPSKNMIDQVYRDLAIVQSLEASVEKDFRHLVQVIDLKLMTLAEKESTTGKLKHEMDEIETDLRFLISNITEAQNHLKSAQLQAYTREIELNDLQLKAFEEELIHKIQSGRVHYNYETGKLEGKVSYRPDILKNTTTLSSLFDRLQEERDPAVLHLDVHLLKDIVMLTMGTAVGGFTVSYFFRLPPTLGYMLGGMIVGPSCADIIGKVSQVETFGQFGSIFLLFGQGLLYSRQRRQAPLVGGPSLRGLVQSAIAYVLYTFLAFAAIIVQTPFFGSRVEVMVLSVSLTLSSSIVVKEFLHRHILLETTFGRVIVEIMAMQDLVIAPIAAFPSLLDHFLSKWHSKGVDQILLFQTTFLYMLFLGACLGLTRYIWPTLMRAVLDSKAHGRRWSSGSGSHDELSTPPQLFTLGLVSFCLASSLLSEHLQMSLEVGAIAAGLVMSNIPHAKQAESTLEPLTNLFGGIYLASLGLIINPWYLLGHFWQILAWCLVVMAVKLTTAFLVLRRLGFSSIAAYAAGFSLGQLSETSLFFMAKSQQSGLISRHTYLMAAATHVILLAVSPFASHTMRHVNDKDLDFTVNQPSIGRHSSKRNVFWANIGVSSPRTPEECAHEDGDSDTTHRRRRQASYLYEDINH